MIEDSENCKGWGQEAQHTHTHKLLILGEGIFRVSFFFNNNNNLSSLVICIIINNESIATRFSNFHSQYNQYTWSTLNHCKNYLLLQNSLLCIQFRVDYVLELVCSAKLDWNPDGSVYSTYMVCVP